MNDKKIIENYRDNHNLVKKYHELIANVFPSISFREWYSKRFWTDKYIPFSIMESDKIISSASVAEMDIIYKGENKKAIQIGAVGTLPEYRNKGLSRKLMIHIINKYKHEVDFFFLHANETVLEFYPKFGFKSVIETTFEQTLNIPISEYSARKLDISKHEDYSLLINLLKNRKVISKLFGADNYQHITMWYVLNLYHENLFYLENEEVIFIKTESEDNLKIIDVIYANPFDINLALKKIIISNTLTSIKYYFSPDQLNYKYDKLTSEDTGLFILGNLELENMQFRFPETAIT